MKYICAILKEVSTEPQMFYFRKKVCQKQDSLVAKTKRWILTQFTKKILLKFICVCKK